MVDLDPHTAISARLRKAPTDPVSRPMTWQQRTCLIEVGT
jgi:hypothetical protein